MAALGFDFTLLLGQRQASNFHHVVEHAGKDGDDLTVTLPVKARFGAEGIDHELGQIDGAQQAGTLWRQRLLATGVGGADILTEPVIVHAVDLVDQDETWLGVVIGRGHDGVP